MRHREERGQGKEAVRRHDAGRGDLGGVGDELGDPQRGARAAAAAPRRNAFPGAAGRREAGEFDDVLSQLEPGFAGLINTAR
jgi:hypothetical protein